MKNGRVSEKEEEIASLTVSYIFVRILLTDLF